MRMFSLGLLLLALGACAPSQRCIDHPEVAGDQFAPCDPARNVNERVFRFNLAADRYVIGPIAHTYHEIPIEGRTTIDNFLTNLSEPSNMLNSALQGDMQATGTTLWRFILNTTFGFGGLRDFAGENGLKYNEQHFNDTLGSYGVADGAYVVLPVVGPSTLRDTGGKVVDWFTDPVGWYLNTPLSIAQTVTDGINDRDQQDAIVDQLYYQSLDPYSATRAAYLQHQAFH